MFELATPKPVATTFRRLHDVANTHLELMTLCYDFDGAVAAHQNGMARYTCGSLLDAAVTLWLLHRNVDVPTFENPPGRLATNLRTLEHIAPSLAKDVWLAYCSDIGHAEEADGGRYNAVIACVSGLAGFDPGQPLTDAAVAAWIESARAVREFCEDLGLPVSPEWYWNPDGTMDGYSHVEAMTRRREPRDRAHKC